MVASEMRVLTIQREQVGHGSEVPSICIWGFPVIASWVCLNPEGDFRMQSAYPLSRCPACKKAFRMEITRLASPPPNLGLINCPHCGLKFQRFDPQYLKGPAPHAAAR